MGIVSEGSPICCCVDVAPSAVEKIRYALRMLLVPLGLEPRWVAPEDVAGGIYYGRAGHGIEDAAVALTTGERTQSFFRGDEAYDPRQATWFESAAGKLPALFVNAWSEPDLIASTFVWLSGWQENAVAERDIHGRVPYEASLSAQFNIANIPVVDAYRAELAQMLREAGILVEERTWNGRRWALCPTHDVDYLRKWRPGILYREFLQNLVLNRRDVPAPERVRRAADAVQQMRRGDPYRTALRVMPDLVSRLGGTATYFFKTGGEDAHDVPYSTRSRFLQDRIASLKKGGFELALHPSYRTPNDRFMLQEERIRLEERTGVQPTSVRHHYLRFDPAETPQLHDALGFRIDSTLGFAEREGFRRGTCTPFQLYDLANDRPLSTWEMPLAVMDSALFNRRGLDCDEALEVTKNLSDVCRRYRGAFVVLWHNTLGDELECPGWMRHFRETLDLAASDEALIASLESALRAWR